MEPKITITSRRAIGAAARALVPGATDDTMQLATTPRIIRWPLFRERESRPYMPNVLTDFGWLLKNGDFVRYIWAGATCALTGAGLTQDPPNKGNT